jgi:small redox-active disulfide protein 2
MIIKVLGSGCAKCKKLEQEAIKAVKEAGIEATIEKVSELKEIMDYGVMMTPALVIDEKVVSTGRVLSAKKIIVLMKS